MRDSIADGGQVSARSSGTNTVPAASTQTCTARAHRIRGSRCVLAPEDEGEAAAAAEEEEQQQQQEEQQQQEQEQEQQEQEQHGRNCAGS